MNKPIQNDPLLNILITTPTIWDVFIKPLMRLSFIVASSAWLIVAQADGTAECNAGTGMFSTECGVNAFASDQFSTAVGDGSDAIALGATAVGTNTIANGSASTAVGNSADATAIFSTAVGNVANASANNSTAVGAIAEAESRGAVSVGFQAGNNESSVTDSPQAIAIGERSNIAAASPGAIAIGGDVNNDEVGALATAPGAIAIGADVVADIPHTLVTNVPILARDPSVLVTPRTMFEISGAGNTKFSVTNTDASESWAFANPGTGFRLSRQGSGSVEFEVKNNGNAVLAGTLTQNSDVNSKQDIKALDQQAILNKVMTLDISEWRYKDDPDSKHIGPMAQDFYQVFRLGDTDRGISTLDSSGVALASIQALKHEYTNLKTVKDKEIAEMKSEIISMQNELIELKGLKQQLALVLAMTGNIQLTQVKSE